MTIAYGREYVSPPDYQLDPAGEPAWSMWTARPELEHVRDFARARRCSPWAVLGVVLARAVTAVPPFVVLPAMVGGHATLNLFVALVGPSGSGKGAAERTGADCLIWPPIDTFSPGSGEGLTRLFVHREKIPAGEDGAGGWQLVTDRTALMLTVPEIDGLSALTGRRGSTLLPQLRQAWSGEDLGFAYADPERALRVPRGTYRLTAVVGVQPGRAGGLLDDADGGTPQRFLWLPTTDPDAPDIAPDCPEPVPWRPPAPWHTDRWGRVVLQVPAAAHEAVDGARLARLRGEGAALDGHALLARLKIAAALAMLAGAHSVDADDWDLAGEVMAVSDATREAVLAHLQRAQSEQNRAQGRAEGERAAVADDVKHERTVQRVGRLIARTLGPDWTSRAVVRRAVASRDRHAADEAIRRLVSAGSVEVDDIDPDRPSYRIGARR